jgi:hypothetical protein
MTWVDPVITSVEGLLGLLSNPPLSYFIGLLLVTGVVAVIRSIVKK